MSLETESNFGGKKTKKHLCFCTLSVLFHGPFRLYWCCLILTESRFWAGRRAPVVQSSLQFSCWSRRTGILTYPTYLWNQKIKCRVYTGHRHYVYIMSTAITKPICHLAFVEIKTLNFLILFQLWVYFTITNG